MDDFDRPFEPWELQDMERLRAGLLARPLGGHMQALQRPYDAEFQPGIGWMAVTPTGRYGSYETEAQALREARRLTGQDVNDTNTN